VGKGDVAAVPRWLSFRVAVYFRGASFYKRMNADLSRKKLAASYLVVGTSGDESLRCAAGLRAVRAKNVARREFD
jgi:hypothetical protein